jgi:hypothetical protein
MRFGSILPSLLAAGLVAAAQGGRHSYSEASRHRPGLWPAPPSGPIVDSTPMTKREKRKHRQAIEATLARGGVTPLRKRRAKHG